MNAHITNFLTIARLMGLDADQLEADRAIADFDMWDPIFDDQRSYLGDQFVEVVANAYGVAWKVDERNLNGAPHMAGLIKPYWQRLVDECPRLSEFWPEGCHQMDNGWPVIRRAA